MSLPLLSRRIDRRGNDLKVVHLGLCVLDYVFKSRTDEMKRKSSSPNTEGGGVDSTPSRAAAFRAPVSFFFPK